MLTNVYFGYQFNGKKKELPGASIEFYNINKIDMKLLLFLLTIMFYTLQYENFVRKETRIDHV